MQADEACVEGDLAVRATGGWSDRRDPPPCSADFHERLLVQTLSGEPMRTSTLIVRSAVAALALGLLAPVSTLAQTFAASTGTEPVISTSPLPTVMKVPLPKNAEEKLLYGRVRDGVYTVDGMVAKVQLNYDVNGVRFLYMFVPGVGTAVISSVADPDAVTAEAKL